MKNKILALLISACTLSTLTACSTGNTSNDGKLKIVTTLYPQYDFVRNITDGNADITLLLTPGAESHSYEPTASDIAKIQQADLFIYNGGESEVWVDRVLDSAGNVKTLRLTDCISPLEKNHEDEHDEHEHEHSEEYDEHIFTSLKNAVVMLDEINESICEVDSENADIYTQNTNNYKSEIKELDKDFEELVSDSKTKTVILADRHPFRYFAQDYGLDFQAAFSGCSHDTDASPATISELIETVQKEEIPVIFTIEFSSRDIAEKIAEATGSEIETLHSCHNISKEDFDNNTTYLQLMKKNYENLSEALN